MSVYLNGIRMVPDAYSDCIGRVSDLHLICIRLVSEEHQMGTGRVFDM